MYVEDDDNDTGALSVTDGADAFLTRWKDPEEVSNDGEEADSKSEAETSSEDEEENKDEATDENEEGSDEDQDSDEDEDSDEGESKDVKYVEDEDAHVKVTVDGEETTVSVKDLKRLAGQEASLTRKSQEVADARKVADENAKVHLVALQTLLERAEAKYKPYAELDFALAAKNLSQEDYQAVREEAQKAYEDYKFLTEEMSGYMQHLEAKRIETYQTAAQEAIKVLTDPKTGIEGWNEELYDSIRDYATNAGMSKELVNSITDPNIIKILHKAMKFDSIKKVSTKKKATAAKKVLKAKGALESSKKGGEKVKSALQVLRAKGDRDSAADAFISKWNDMGGDD